MSATATAATEGQRPRSSIIIERSVGSRIRLAFGKTGADWLLILNEDDGSDRTWQSISWSPSSSSSSSDDAESSGSSGGGTSTASGIPCGLVRQLDIIKNRREYDVNSVDFGGPTGAWFVQGRRATDGIYCCYGDCASESSSLIGRESHGVPGLYGELGIYFGSTLFNLETAVTLHGGSHSNSDNAASVSQHVPLDLKCRLQQIQQGHDTIHFLRLFHHNNYVISSYDSTNGGQRRLPQLQWSMGVGPRLYSELQKQHEEKVEEVALAENGNDWIVLRESTFVVSGDGVSETLRQQLEQFYRVQAERNNNNNNANNNNNRLQVQIQSSSLSSSHRVAQVQVHDHRELEAALEAGVSAARDRLQLAAGAGRMTTAAAAAAAAAIDLQQQQTTTAQREVVAAAAAAPAPAGATTSSSSSSSSRSDDASRLALQWARAELGQRQVNMAAAQYDATARRAAENAAATARATAELESLLEERFLQEARSIADLEQHIRQRRCDLQASLHKLPPAVKTRIEKECKKASSKSSNNSSSNEDKPECVICQAKTPTRAVIPCGHLCLCDDCAQAFVGGNNNSRSSSSSRSCPLCRGQFKGTIKIYGSTAAL